MSCFSFLVLPYRSEKTPWFPRDNSEAKPGPDAFFSCVETSNASFASRSRQRERKAEASSAARPRQKTMHDGDITERKEGRSSEEKMLEVSSLSSPPASSSLEIISNSPWRAPLCLELRTLGVKPGSGSCGFRKNQGEFHARIDFFSLAPSLSLVAFFNSTASFLAERAGTRLERDESSSLRSPFRSFSFEKRETSSTSHAFAGERVEK